MSKKPDCPNHNMCLTRGLDKLRADEATGAAKVEAVHLFNNMRKGDQGRLHYAQKTAALRYHEVTVVPNNRPRSLLDIPMFENIFGVSVVVFSAHLHNKVIDLDTQCQ